METDLKFEFKVDLKPVRHKSYRYRMARLSEEPRLRQYLILAYQIRDALERDNAITSRRIAEWLNMTPARVSQILNFLSLCPTIQEDILLSQNEKIRGLSEYKICKIVKEIDWGKTARHVA